MSNTASTMLAAVASTLPSSVLELTDLPRPRVEAPDDVVLEVEACGVCGTDLHILAGESYAPQLPFVLGHEPVGVVVDAGPDALEWIGRRATMTLFTGDGTCAHCRAGDERLCPDLVSITGVLGVWGAYAQYVRVHARQLLEVPSELSGPDVASLVDSGATAANAVRTALVRSPDRVLVLGAGPIGHLAAEILRARGLAPQVVEPNRLRRDAVAGLGHHVLGALAGVRTGVHAVIDCTGTPAVVTSGLETLAPHGQYVLAGYARVPNVDFGVVARKEVEIRGIRSGRRDDLEALIGLVAAGQVQLPEIAQWPLSEINDALAALRAGMVRGKAVIVPDPVRKDRSA